MNIKKLLNKISASILTFVFSGRALASTGSSSFFDQPAVYGPPPSMRNSLSPLDMEWWSLYKIALYLALPLILLICIIIGIIVLIKRKRKKNAQENNEVREAENVDIPPRSNP